MKLRPDVFVETVFDIDLEDMKARGIKAFFFDIDNTLEEYSTPLPTENSISLFRKMACEGFFVAIISNAKEPRVLKFISGFPKEDFPEVYYVFEALKPKKKGYKYLAEKLNLKPEEIAMVGDQVFTDILGGNNYGCLSIAVRPINLEIEPGFVRFKRFFERPFAAYVKKNK